MILRREVQAKYIGPAHPALGDPKDEQLHDITVVTTGKSPELIVQYNNSSQEISYPSLKKFHEHWDCKLEEAKVAKAPKRKRDSDITITDAGAVIYTEIIASINRCNGHFAHVYKDEPWKIAKFEVKLSQEVHNEETQAEHNVYGSAVLTMTVNQFGSNRVIYQDGISFRTEKELSNINSYAPKMYIKFQDSLVESALLYILALNPDNPDNVKALEEDVLDLSKLKDATEATTTAPISE